MMGYAGAYNPYQAGPPLTFGGVGQQATPFNGPPNSLPQLGPIAPQYGGQPQGGGGGGWLGALGQGIGNFTGFNDMSGMQKAYMLASVGGGVANYFEQKAQRDEEKRRWEQAYEDSRRHRQMMGQNLNAAWGG